MQALTVKTRNTMSNEQPQVDIAALAAAAGQEMRPKVIWTAQRYFNQDGLCIEQRTIIKGDETALKDFAYFVAFGSVVMELDQGKDSQGRPLPKKEKRQPLAVAVEAKDILEAFEKAPALIEKEAEECKVSFAAHVENVRKAAIEQRAQEALRRKLVSPVGLTPGLTQLPNQG
jgi:hypothetical protein